MEQQLARDPHLYSRIGFARKYQPIDPKDIPAVLSHNWEQLRCTYNTTDPADAETAKAIATVSGGNFRLIERLTTQITRVMTINQLQTIVPAAVKGPSDARHRHCLDRKGGRTAPHNSSIHSLDQGGAQGRVVRECRRTV